MSEVPICRDCAHLVGKRTYLEDAANWKCGHPSNVVEVIRDPVTGDNTHHYRFVNCYDTRKAGMCGAAGTLFQPYERPSSADIRTAAKRFNTPSAEDLLGELGL